MLIRSFCRSVNIITWGAKFCDNVPHFADSLHCESCLSSLLLWVNDFPRDYCCSFWILLPHNLVLVHVGQET